MWEKREKHTGFCMEILRRQYHLVNCSVALKVEHEEIMFESLN
jgi:hypothetical protein